MSLKKRGKMEAEKDKLKKKIKAYKCHEAGYPIREIGAMLKISKSIAHQYINEIKNKKELLKKIMEEKIDLPEITKKEKTIKKNKKYLLEEQEEYFKNLPSWEGIKNNFKISEKRRSIPAKIKKESLFRDDYKCRICGRKYSLDTHHIVPICYGGEESVRNVLTLCKLCHKYVPANPRDIIMLMKEGIDVFTFTALRLSKLSLTFLIEQGKIKVSNGIGLTEQSKELEKIFEEKFKKIYRTHIEIINDSEETEPMPM